ncbi:hypothetical protein [Paenibacillus ehimensis]|uniref:Uncharacterized protein n=1 Tax=Paenibacillus ehimensis TaxID=79264 RepID=A0ABT8V3C5_9BACL|nr:hypothetical protein [Paenibacillus ehimensis]MDO3675931.1 hypothetical protein [Paenibacillus ehimensis]
MKDLDFLSEITSYKAALLEVICKLNDPLYSRENAVKEILDVVAGIHSVETECLKTLV